MIGFLDALNLALMAFHALLGLIQGVEAARRPDPKPVPAIVTPEAPKPTEAVDRGTAAAMGLDSGVPGSQGDTGYTDPGPPARDPHFHR